jgi:hypothetical protein
MDLPGQGRLLAAAGREITERSSEEERRLGEPEAGISKFPVPTKQQMRRHRSYFFPAQEKPRYSTAIPVLCCLFFMADAKTSGYFTDKFGTPE